MSFSKTPENLRAKGMEYQILFPFRRDSSKWIFKALRKDRQTGIGQNVLIKIFLKDKESYRYEFESLSRVSSPFCVRLLGFESFPGGKKALILEYIKGLSLFCLLEHFSLNPQERRHILTGIYKGLEDLKKQGLCHGDLSLNNVLIDDRSRIKLIDFGKANCSSPQGTPPFSAPEILRGARPGFASDLYSLGVIEALLERPYPLSSLKDLKREDLQMDSPLLASDPAQRLFPYETAWHSENHCVKSLTYKVKELLSALEGRRLRTSKYKLSDPPPPLRFSLAGFSKAFALFFALSFAAPSGSGAKGRCCGLIKIYTHKWHIIQVGGISAYSPLAMPLKQGAHTLKWKNREREGSLQVFISKGQSLSLNEKSFQNEQESLSRGARQKTQQGAQR